MSISLPSIVRSSDPAISRGIFYDLLDSDLKILGQTSKKMDEVVKKEIASRDLKLKELLAPFLVSREFNTLNSKKPSTFLVGDMHGNPNCMKALSRLVGHLSRRAPVFFISEGVQSMKQCQADFFFGPNFQYTGANKLTPRLVSFPDELISKENIHGLGWDIEGNGNLLVLELNKLHAMRMRLKQGLLMKALEMCPLLPMKLRAPGLWNKLGVAQELLARLFKEGRSDLLDTYYYNFTTLFLEQVSTYIRNNSDELENNNKELLLASEHYRGLYYDVMRQDLELKEKLSEVSAKLMNFIKSEIDSRTVSMVSTLKQIDPYRLGLKIQEHFIVFSAGISHLENRSNGGADFDLRCLYEELENHNAQILVPLCLLGGKIISADNFNKILHPILRELVTCIEKGLDSTSDEVQIIIKRHYIYVEEFYSVTNSPKEAYTSMAQTIGTHPVMRKIFDRFHPHLSTFMADAMREFAGRELK